MPTKMKGKEIRNICWECKREGRAKEATKTYYSQEFEVDLCDEHADRMGYFGAIKI